MNGTWDIGDIRPGHYFITSALMLGLLFSLVDSGNDNRMWLSLLVQWWLQTLLPILLLIGTQQLLERWSAFRRLNPWWQLVFSGVIGASLFSPLALGIDVAMEGQPDNWAWEWIGEWMAVTPPITLAWLALNAPWLMGFKLIKVTEAELPESTPQTATESGFIRQLPLAVRGRIMVLKAELHYLSVTTDKGQGLILYNLKDAISECDEEGIQCHRSFFVAKWAVRRLSQQGRTGTLLLINDQQVPVAKSRLSAVKAFLSQ
ncbi:LytTR family DNA-binding domain-containing protein [Aliiglaciecola sp. CAU 1673]|uniref:LytTR family DNA-binding domain-containing protein n=1 Tax=Aliiglaciecola sp. CAU 1673 TaxID=3032595 RepID=UPI0023D9959D|nr:LytTR family DNA-binding domain-containing protein [Aliiglaciecola sp. CAU 1673]MDF2180124.1 LytTR family DNA-binding domain-containing protein [Aliiglaciecola sp. CAU 1673]